MIPPTINLDDHYRGDAWEGISFGPIVEDINGTPTPPALACVSCRMQFRKKRGLELGYELSSVPATGKGTITIVDAATYEFSVPRQLILLDAGDWLWDFETTDSAGLPTTWVQGTLLVKQDKTYG